MSKNAPSLPTNRAFVVQFRASTEGRQRLFKGRVEHLVSGQAVRFHSVKELKAFMTGVLTEVESAATEPLQSETSDNPAFEKDPNK